MLFSQEIKLLVIAHHALSIGAAADPRWRVAARMALGERNGEIDINVAGNSARSSVLPVKALHAQAAPQARYVGAGRVPNAAARFLEPPSDGGRAYVSTKDRYARLRGTRAEGRRNLGSGLRDSMFLFNVNTGAGLCSLLVARYASGLRAVFERRRLAVLGMRTGFTNCGLVFIGRRVARSSPNRLVGSLIRV